MVSKLDPVSMIFALSLFNKYLAASAKYLDGTIINVYRNYGGFCIGTALMKGSDTMQRTTSSVPNNYPSYFPINNFD
jgi:hypothetical protein